MHFFTQAGLAAAMASVATALAINVVTNVDVVSVTELVYVNPAGQTLSEVAETAAVPLTHAGSPDNTATYSAPATTTSAAVVYTSPSTESIPPNKDAGSSTFQTSTTPSSSAEATSAAASTPAQTSAAPSASSGSPSGCADPLTFFDAAESLCEDAEDKAYCVGAIGATNLHRANHTVAPVSWNNTLAQWAKTHTDQCIFQDYLNDDGTEHQSNAYAGYGEAGDAEAATACWYNSEEPVFAMNNLYGVASPPAKVLNAAGQSVEIGHFANVVYKEWTTMGCATTLCDSVAGMTNANLTLCFYSPYSKSKRLNTK